MRPILLTIVLALTSLAAAEMALIQPKEAAALVTAKGAQPVVFHVGPNFLYRGKRIPGSLYAGPGGKVEGLTLLRQAAEKLPHDRQIILYCGCCPWDRCPNVKPAIELLQKMGFAKVKALYLPTNFATDWIDAGLPVEGGR